MAFGNVRVTSESGVVEEYTLDKPTTSVGRQPGNDIVLQTTAVSRYHAQFDVTDGRVYLVDLGAVNGTFVNDKQMEPNSRVAMQNGDEITMGDIRLFYISPEAREYFSLTPSVEPVEEEGMPFRLLLDEPHQDVAPGARLNLVMILENTGVDDSSYTIEVGGMEESWVRANWRELTLSPNQQAEVQISVRPPRAPTTLPGTYALYVRVALKDDPLKVLEATRRIDIVGYNGIAMDVRREERNGQYEVIIQNQGNQPTKIQFGGFTREGQLDYSFNPRQVELQPGELKSARLRVKPKSPVGLSKTEQLDFAVVARSLDSAAYQAPIPAQYTLTTSPVTVAAGIGIPLVFGIIGTLILLIILLFAFDILPPGSALPEPTPTEETTGVVEPTVFEPNATLASTPVAIIHQFSAQPAEIIYRAQGQVILSWDVDNVSEVAVFEDDRKLELDSEELAAGQVEIAAENLPLGETEFRLNVVGEDRLPINQLAFVTVQVQICTLDQGARAYEGPSEESQPLPRPERRSVWIVGRNADVSWIRVQYGEDGPQGWVRVDTLSCEAGSIPFADFFIISTPDPTEEPPTETPETNEGG